VQGYRWLNSPFILWDSFQAPKKGVQPQLNFHPTIQAVVSIISLLKKYRSLWWEVRVFVLYFLSKCKWTLLSLSQYLSSSSLRLSSFKNIQDLTFISAVKQSSKNHQANNTKNHQTNNTKSRIKQKTSCKYRTFLKSYSKDSFMNLTNNRPWLWC
jgi:hypothetical protein